MVKIERIGGAYERHWSGAKAFLDEDCVCPPLTGRRDMNLHIWATGSVARSKSTAFHDNQSHWPVTIEEPLDAMRDRPTEPVLSVAANWVF